MCTTDNLAYHIVEHCQYCRSNNKLLIFSVFLLYKRHPLLSLIVNIVVIKTRGLIILYLTTIVTMIDNRFMIFMCTTYNLASPID